MELSQQLSYNGTSDVNQQVIGPGVRRGVKRGRYTTIQGEKEKVIDAALDEEVWKAVSTVNCVPLKTAYGWIRRYNVEEVPKQKGGARNKKVMQLHIDDILRYIDTDPPITLETIKQYILMRDMSISISTTTIHNHLDCQFYSIKKARPQPATMNSDENKAKRSQYVCSLMSFVGLEKYIIYIDESNCNMFLRRSFGRSKKESVVVSPYLLQKEKTSM